MVKELSERGAQARGRIRSLDEPEALRAWREQAWERFEELPAPRYERSDLSRRRVDAFAPEPPERAGDWEALAAPFIGSGDEHPLLVFADGRLVLARSLDGLAGSGVRFMSLREAARVSPELVKEHLGRAVPAGADKWLALNAALWRDGAFVHAPKGADPGAPLQIVCVTTGAGSGSFWRHLVIAEEGSRLAVLETYAAPADLGDEFFVGVTEVSVGARATVKAGAVSDLPRRATSVAVRRAVVAEGGDMRWVVGEMGDGYTVAEVGSHLAGEGSRSESSAIALGTGRSHLDLTARMIHSGRFSESGTSARGVMQGRADAVYRGVTEIRKGAGGANGQQTEKLLMLSPQSRADAIPMLLIDENDVKCGHAASVGQIDENQMFYLMSRGVSESAAKRMIVWGFIDPVLAELPADAVRAAVERLLERKMA